ncbi:NADase-type glycan-binding domain-containing protein [Streptomyces sp. NPDC002643]
MTSETSGPGREPARSCAECGTRAEPGQSFCDSCGAVLNWSGTAPRSEPAATTPARTGATTSDAEPPADSSRAEPTWDAFARPGAGTGTARTAHDGSAPASATSAASNAAAGTTASVTASTLPRRTRTRTTTEPETPDTPDAPTEPTTPDPAATAATEPLPTAAPSPAVPSTTDRARSLLIPVDDPEPQAPATPAVAPVLPGRPLTQRPQVRAPGPESGTEGGVPCPWCATPNRPERHYCGRCAMPMAGNTDAPMPGRQRWWHRLPWFRAEQTPWAGDRPRLRRGFGRILPWLVGALVVSLIITLVVNLDDGIQATRDHFAKRAPVGPNSVKASRSYPDHDAKLAFDKYSNTWWGPGVTQTGEGEWLEAHFDQPTRLLDVIITPGVSSKADQRDQSARPQRIEARITLGDGSKITKFIDLDQSSGGQRRKFRVGAVTDVRFILRSAYGADAKKQVAIAEIEFFGPSKNNT